MKDEHSSLIPFLHSGAIDIARCNAVAAKFGIKLSQSEAAALSEARVRALNRTGRVEFEGTVIEKLVIAFCDSPFLTQDGFADAMEDIIEMFYEFKNDTLDEVDDDDAIALMKRMFDGNCMGSLEWLREDLGRYARGIRRGEAEQGDDIYDE